MIFGTKNIMKFLAGTTYLSLVIPYIGQIIGICWPNIFGCCWVRHKPRIIGPCFHSTIAKQDCSRHSWVLEWCNKQHKLSFKLNARALDRFYLCTWNQGSIFRREDLLATFVTCKIYCYIPQPIFYTKML